MWLKFFPDRKFGWGGGWPLALMLLLVFFGVKNLNGQLTDWKTSCNFRGKVAECIHLRKNHLDTNAIGLPSEMLHEKFNPDGYRTSLTKVRYYIESYKKANPEQLFYAGDTLRAKIFYDTLNRVVCYIEEDKPGTELFIIGSVARQGMRTWRYAARVSKGRIYQTLRPWDSAHKEYEKGLTVYKYYGQLIQLADNEVQFQYGDLAYGSGYLDFSNRNNNSCSRPPLISEHVVEVSKWLNIEWRLDSITGHYVEKPLYNSDSTIYNFSIVNGLGRLVFKEVHSRRENGEESKIERFLRQGDSCSLLVFENGSWKYKARGYGYEGYYQNVPCWGGWGDRYDPVFIKKRLEEIDARNAELRQCGALDSALLPSGKLYGYRGMGGIDKYEFDDCGNWIKHKVFDENTGILVYEEIRDIKYYAD